MDLKQLSELKIPQDPEKRNEALEDALETCNPLLIEFALAIGADPVTGGECLLEYAVGQGKLELVKKLVPETAEGATAAMNLATSSYHEIKIELASWLLSQGAVMRIDRQCIVYHADTVKSLLTANPNLKASIEYEALECTVNLKDGAAELLEMLLDYIKRNSHENFDKWLEKLADYTVDTDRVDCMETMRRYGLDLKRVNTKWYSQSMKEYLAKHGISVRC